MYKHTHKVSRHWEIQKIYDDTAIVIKSYLFRQRLFSVLPNTVASDVVSKIQVMPHTIQGLNNTLSKMI